MRQAAVLSMLLCALLHADIESDIDSLFKSYDSSKVPGAAVLVIRPTEPTLMKVYGLAELSTSRATKSSTNYRLASLSKQFTAMAALILVDSGDLDLEESLQEIFPDFPDYGKNIRIRNLMHHTSGLKSYESLVPSGFRGQVDDAWVLDRLKQQRSGDFTPGSKYSYSNSGYCVLSQVVAKRSKQSYAEFVTQKIFEPLGMKSSRVTDKTPPVIDERAYGYTASGGGFSLTDQSSTSATQGDGGIYTSLIDYQKWIEGLSSLLSLSTHAHLFTPGKLNSGASTGYAAGWSVDSHKGHVRYTHTGSSIGFRTAVQHFPHNGLTVLVLVNRAGASPWSEAGRIVDLLL